MTRRKPDSNWGQTAALILDALATIGPMTNIECCEHIGQDKYRVGAVFSRLKTASPRHPKRIHISHWVYDQPGARRYPRAVYAIGDKPDARRPKSDQSANARRYRNSKVARVASVFDLGLTVRQRLYRKAA